MSPLRSLLAALLVVASLGAFEARAATQLDLARAQANKTRQVVTDTRKQQMALRSELTQVSARIESLKAKGQTFLASPELDSQLRRSQELSARLTELAQSVSTAEASSQQAALAYLTVVNDELGRLRATIDRTPAQDRKNAIAQIRQLREERDRVRAQLPASVVPALKTTQSDDPDELIEQADALRDSEDKVRAQMKALQARIQEAREEKELDRRIEDFGRDESMFDDQDRRLRMRKEETSSLHVDRAPPLNSAERADMAAGGPMGVGGTPNNPSPQSFDENNPRVGDPSSDFTRVTKAADALPVVGQVKPNKDEGSDVESLEGQLKRLKQQADELKARADALEAKAAGK